MLSKVRLRSLFSRFRPIEHVPPIFNNNVHDLARVGGVSVLTLPNEYAPCDLVIPTRFAATAQFLVDIGLEQVDMHVGHLVIEEATLEDGTRPKWTTRVVNKGPNFNISGLFRIPGSKVTTERLRAYFERQMYDGGGTIGDRKTHGHDIEYTVRLGSLPNQSVLPYQIHDVASCFKSFLGDLDGGVLGCLDIFEGLRKVALPRRHRKSSESAGMEWKCIGIGITDEEEPIDPKHIARIFCSIQCAASRNLILAVFGLLAFFMVDDSPLEQIYEQPQNTTGFPIMDEMRQSCFPSPAPPDARMTAEALGRIFAPLMLGDELTKHVNVNFTESYGSRNKENHRRSWVPSPRKRTTPSPSKKHPSGRIKQQTASGINRTNVTVHVHPHPLHSQPYLASQSFPSLHETNSFSDFYPRSRNDSQIDDSPLKFQNGNLSTESIMRAHTNCSAPNLPSLAGGKRWKREKEGKVSKSEGLLHAQQARILLIANVITIILWNWRDVCLELRAIGYGRGEGRWYVGTSETDGV